MRLLCLILLWVALIEAALGDGPATFHVHGATLSGNYDVYPGSPSTLLVGSGAAYNAPPTGSASASSNVVWMFVVSWPGASNHQPSASGSGTVTIRRETAASAGSHLNCSASGNASVDGLTSGVSVSGAQTATDPRNTSDNYSVNGASLSFTYDSMSGTWIASLPIVTNSTSAYASATAPTGSKGSNGDSSGVAGLSNTDIDLGTLSVHYP